MVTWPSRATRSMCGPPGNGRPSSRATLSKASPAASSMVAPSGSTPSGHVGDLEQRRVPARDQHRQARLGQRAVLELVDGDVRGEVVHAVQRLAEAERQRLGRGDPDEQGAGQARSAGDGDRVDVVQPYAGGLARALDASAPSPRGAPARRPPGRRRRSGRARRRELATASASSVVPRTMPTPVSSHEVSMPSTSGAVGCHAEHSAGRLHLTDTRCRPGGWRRLRTTLASCSIAHRKGLHAESGNHERGHVWARSPPSPRAPSSSASPPAPAPLPPSRLGTRSRRAPSS